MRLAVAAISVGVLGGCTGFFRAAQVPVGGVGTPAPTGPGAAGNLPAAYVTLRVIKSTDALARQAPSASSRLEVLKLDAELQDDPSRASLRVPLLAYDFRERADEVRAPFPLDGYPLRPGADGKLTLTFRTSGIEQPLAGPFLKGLEQFEGTVAAGATSPSDGARLTAASAVLTAFESSKPDTSSTLTVTLDTHQSLAGQAFAVLLAPTAGGAEARARPYALCRARSEALCTLTPGGGEEPVGDYAYVVVFASASDRLPLLGTTAPRGCSFGPGDLRGYSSALERSEPFLTVRQRHLERALLESAERLLRVRERVARGDLSGALQAISSEWAAAHGGGASADAGDEPYRAAHARLSACMIAEGEALRPGLFGVYRDVLDGTYDASDAEAPLKELLAIRATLDAEALGDGALNTALADGAALLESRIYGAAFAGPVKRLEDGETRPEALRSLKHLLATSACASCKRAALKAMGGVPGARLPEDVLPAVQLATDKARVEGALALAERLAVAQGRTLRLPFMSEIQKVLSAAETLATRALSAGKAPARGATSRLAQALRGYQAELEAVEPGLYGRAPPSPHLIGPGERKLKDALHQG